MVKIIPAILEKDFYEIEKKINLVKNVAQMIQIDICDGEFVPIKTWPYVDLNDLAKIRSDFGALPKIDYELHLMVEDPGKIIDDFVSVSVKRILIHFEIGTDKIFNLILQWGKTTEIGLAVNLETDLADLKGFFDKVSVIQLMGRGHLGEQGYVLDSKIFKKIKELKALGFKGLVSVDGGVNLENIKELKNSGADILVVGSALWQGGLNSNKISEQFSKFNKILVG